MPETDQSFLAKWIYAVNHRRLSVAKKDALVASEQMLKWFLESESEPAPELWKDENEFESRLYSMVVCAKPDELLQDWYSGSRLVFVSGHSTDDALNPPVSETDELEVIFNGLAKNWKEATGGYSLTYRRFAHPTYLSLLVFAENNKDEIIPLILRELTDHPDWWFEALKFLTDADPTKKGDNFTEAAKAWLNWGKERKLIT